MHDQNIRKFLYYPHEDGAKRCRNPSQSESNPSSTVTTKQANEDRVKRKKKNSFIQKASPEKLHLQSFTHKASPKKLHPQSFTQKKNFTRKASLKKASPTKLHLKKLHLESFTYIASPRKLHLQSFTIKASPRKLHLQSFNTKASPTKLQHKTLLQINKFCSQNLNIFCFTPTRAQNLPSYLFTYICSQTYYNRSNNKPKSQVS